VEKKTQGEDTESAGCDRGAIIGYQVWPPAWMVPCAKFDNLPREGRLGFLIPMLLVTTIAVPLLLPLFKTMDFTEK